MKVRVRIADGGFIEREESNRYLDYLDEHLGKYCTLFIAVDGEHRSLNANNYWRLLVRIAQLEFGEEDHDTMANQLKIQLNFTEEIQLLNGDFIEVLRSTNTDSKTLWKLTDDLIIFLKDEFPGIIIPDPNKVPESVYAELMV